MRSLPAPRHRSARRPRGLATLVAILGALVVGLGILTVTSRLSGLIVAAELAAGAALQAGTGQALLMSWAVVALAGAAALTMLSRRTRVDRPRGRRAGGRPAGFELRSPERALAESDRGMLRFKE